MIEARELTKKYGGKTAVDRLTFTVRPGRVGLLGLAVGTLIRHSAGAVVTVVGVLLLPSLFGPLLGDLQRWVAGAAPTGALEKLTQTSVASPETVGSLGAWPSLGLVAAYTVLLLGVAAWRLRRRDA